MNEKYIFNLVFVKHDVNSKEIFVQLQYSLVEMVCKDECIPADQVPKYQPPVLYTF